MPDELQAIVDEHYQNLYRFALSLTRSSDDAWDLTQESFLRLTRNRASIRASKAIKSWLYTTLYREFLRLAKRGSRYDSLDGLDSPEPVDSHDSNQIQKAEAGDALQALLQLKSGYRQVVSLYYLESYSYKEIAQILDIPIGTVMSRLARGKDILKSILSRPQDASNLVDFDDNARKASHG